MYVVKHRRAYVYSRLSEDIQAQHNHKTSNKSSRGCKTSGSYGFDFKDTAATRTPSFITLINSMLVPKRLILPFCFRYFLRPTPWVRHHSSFQPSMYLESIKKREPYLYGRHHRCPDWRISLHTISMLNEEFLPGNRFKALPMPDRKLLIKAKLRQHFPAIAVARLR